MHTCINLCYPLGQACPSATEAVALLTLRNPAHGAAPASSHTEARVHLVGQHRIFPSRQPSA